MKRLWIGKNKNCILVLVVAVINIAVMGVCFDFYYDLNDDTMMRDIMAGIYSGTPDGHNMQTLYPLGALIALLYRICRSVPWYGLFLCLCQFGCFYLIGVRLCTMAERAGVLSKDAKAGKRNFGRWITLLLMPVLFQWGVCLSHLISIQYTITCALLSATAIFLFITTADGLNIQQFVVKNIPAMILVIVAFQLRTEMLLLTFPFICLAGLYRLTEEKGWLSKDHLCKYGVMLGTMLAGMILSLGIDYAAYSGEDWKDFRSFFDARTTVYDFYPELITEDCYSEELERLGVKPHQQTLLRNYNFGLDDTIDTALLADAADYAVNTLGASKDWVSIGREKIYAYFYRIFHSGDAPYNLLVLWAYAAVLAAGFFIYRKDGRNRYAFLWQTVLLGMVRSAIWMFILMRGREPQRITHSLYLVEFALLAAMFLRMLSMGAIQGAGRGIMRGLVMLLMFLAAESVIDNLSGVREDQERREWVNTGWYEIDAYCREHEENFYFEDVYSTVSFSQKIFDGTDNSYANYDIMGGWMCKSPLYYKKLEHYKIDSVHAALLDRDDVYMIISDNEVRERGVEWIIDYYSEQGIVADVEQTDKIGDFYGVYRVTGNGKL